MSGPWKLLLGRPLNQRRKWVQPLGSSLCTVFLSNAGKRKKCALNSICTYSLVGVEIVFSFTSLPIIFIHINEILFRLIWDYIQHINLSKIHFLPSYINHMTSFLKFLARNFGECLTGTKSFSLDPVACAFYLAQSWSGNKLHICTHSSAMNVETSTSHWRSFQSP